MVSFMKNFLKIDNLKASGAKPSWFGLGFIQLQMDERHRMHFWHPELPSDSAYDEEWHDHRYSFDSHVLVGSIRNEIAFSVPNPNGDMSEYEVCCEGNGAVFKQKVDLNYLTEFETKAGESYFLQQDALHKVWADRCVTVQTRYLTDIKPKARVVASKYASPNPFEAHLPEDHLWGIIEDLIGKPGYHMANIQKGVLGEVSKIREEVEELADAVDQEAKIMQLVELSDLTGAIEAFLDRHHPNISVHDLFTMKDITKRAFVNGHRT